MSFKSVLVGVEHGLGIAANDAQVVAPLISAVYPPAGAIVSTVSALVIAAEKAFPDVPTAGADKKQSVVTDINAALPLLQAGLSLAGVKFTVTPELSAAISKTVDDVVALLNDMAVLKAAIEGAPVVPKP